MRKALKMRCAPRGFTLVELLVVIGIIALLISILLPSLNKAREQANLIKCQANLHSIGEALAIYENDQKNCMPMGEFNRLPTVGNKEPQWYWIFTLGQILNRNMIGSDGYVHNLSGVFADTDTLQGKPFRWVSHYTCNPALFRDPTEYFGSPAKPTDILGNSQKLPRKVTSVKDTASAFVIWDGAQAANCYNDAPPGSPNDYYSAFPVAQGIDGYGFYSTGLYSGVIDGTTVRTDLPILPTSDGLAGLDNGAAAQKQCNVDVDSYSGNGSPPWQSLRFRHLDNTRLNALCLDGHVETRAVGTVLRKDIYTNAP